MDDLIEQKKMELSTMDSAKLVEIVENLYEQFGVMAITIQSLKSDMTEMRKQLRYAVPLSNPQVKKLNECIRNRADELLRKYGRDDAGAAKRLSNSIRKSICTSFGAGTVREIPKCEFTQACAMAGKWFDIFAYKKAVETVDRNKEEVSSAQRGRADQAVPQDRQRRD